LLVCSYFTIVDNMNIKTDYRKQHKSYGIKTQYSVDSFNKQIIDLLNNDSASNGDFC
jgi:hypothetical protein